MKQLIHTLKTRQCRKKTPVNCRIYDIVYMEVETVGEDGERKICHEPCSIVQLDNGFLLFTYGRYMLFPFAYACTYTKGAICLDAYKKDGTVLQVGNLAQVYVRRIFLHEDVRIDIEKNTVRLKGQEFVFRHKNEAVDITVFDHVQIFEGYVEIG